MINYLFATLLFSIQINYNLQTFLHGEIFCFFATDVLYSWFIPLDFTTNYLFALASGFFTFIANVRTFCAHVNGFRNSLKKRVCYISRFMFRRRLLFSRTFFLASEMLKTLSSVSRYRVALVSIATVESVQGPAYDHRVCIISNRTELQRKIDIYSQRA